MPQRIRQDLRAIFAAALRAVNGRRVVRKALTGHALGNFGHLSVIGMGKASASMALGAVDVFGPQIRDGLVIVNDGSARDIEGIEVREAGHPIPDQRGLLATRELLAIADAAGRDDVVICLISGGGSALLVAPQPGISLEDLARENHRLLMEGTPIAQFNAVRRGLSQVKGGGLADRIAPARLIALAISDVPGDDPAVIASGPVGNAQVIANVEMAAEAAAVCARELGYRTNVSPWRLLGEAREVGSRLATTPLDPGECRIWGGETTVTVTGGGRGGRSQELALAASLAIADDRTLLAAGTDGIDGPTDAAGAIVDGTTGTRADNVRAHLDDNDAWTYLKAAGALVQTGPTGTNVADLVVAARPRSLLRD